MRYSRWVLWLPRLIAFGSACAPSGKPDRLTLALVLLLAVFLTPRLAGGVGTNEPIGCDAALTRSIDDPSEADRFTFNVAEGERVAINVVNGTPVGANFSVQWRLLTGAGAAAASCGGFTNPRFGEFLRDCGPLPASGNPYQIEVRDQDSDDIGAYRVSIDGVLQCTTTTTTTTTTLPSTTTTTNPGSITTTSTTSTTSLSPSTTSSTTTTPTTVLPTTSATTSITTTLTTSTTVPTLPCGNGVVDSGEVCDPTVPEFEGCCDQLFCRPKQVGTACGIDEGCGTPVCDTRAHCRTQPDNIDVQCRKGGTLGYCDPGAFCTMAPGCPDQDVESACEAVNFAYSPAKGRLKLRCQAKQSRKSTAPLRCGAALFGAASRGVAALEGEGIAPRAADVLSASNCTGPQFAVTVGKRMKRRGKGDLARVVSTKIQKADRRYFAPGSTVCVRVTFDNRSGFLKTRNYSISISEP